MVPWTDSHVRHFIGLLIISVMVGMSHGQLAGNSSTALKGGACPEVAGGGFGLCNNLCYHDNDCPGYFKCCANSCGTVCKKPVGYPNIKNGYCPLASAPVVPTLTAEVCRARNCLNQQPQQQPQGTYNLLNQQQLIAGSTAQPTTYSTLQHGAGAAVAPQARSDVAAAGDVAGNAYEQPIREPTAGKATQEAAGADSGQPRHYYTLEPEARQHTDA